MFTLCRFTSLIREEIGIEGPLSDKNFLKMSGNDARFYTMNNKGHDVFSPEKRSKIMSLVKSRDTKPELKVRSALHRLGYRFRVHRRDMPGSPDIVLPKYRTVVLVHGCFWHQHAGCKKATIPKTNHAKWQQKLERNVRRDQEAIADLEAGGWNVVVLWECDLRKHFSLEVSKLNEVLRSQSKDLQQELRGNGGSTGSTGPIDTLGRGSEEKALFEPDI